MLQLIFAAGNKPRKLDTEVKQNETVVRDGGWINEKKKTFVDESVKHERSVIHLSLVINLIIFHYLNVDLLI